MTASTAAVETTTKKNTFIFIQTYAHVYLRAYTYNLRLFIRITDRHKSIGITIARQDDSCTKGYTYIHMYLHTHKPYQFLLCFVHSHSIIKHTT